MNSPPKHLYYTTLFLLNSFNKFDQKAIAKTFENFNSYEEQDQIREKNLSEINQFLQNITTLDNEKEVVELLKKQTIEIKFFIYEKLIVLQHVLKKDIQPVFINSDYTFLEILSLSLQSSWELIAAGTLEGGYSVSEVFESILLEI